MSDFLNDRILRFDYGTKAFKDVFVQKGSGGLQGPWGIAFNKFDDSAQPRTFYVASEGTSRCPPPPPLHRARSPACRPLALPLAASSSMTPATAALCASGQMSLVVQRA